MKGKWGDTQRLRELAAEAPVDVMASSSPHFHGASLPDHVCAAWIPKRRRWLVLTTGARLCGVQCVVQGRWAHTHGIACRSATSWISWMPGTPRALAACKNLRPPPPPPAAAAAGRDRTAPCREGRNYISHRYAPVSCVVLRPSGLFRVFTSGARRQRHGVHEAESSFLIHISGQARRSLRGPLGSAGA